jgi:hypothetical protein
VTANAAVLRSDLETAVYLLLDTNQITADGAMKLLAILTRGY